jgi:hypothetical protein
MRVYLAKMETFPSIENSYRQARGRLLSVRKRTFGAHSRMQLSATTQWKASHRFTKVISMQTIRNFRALDTPRTKLSGEIQPAVRPGISDRRRFIVTRSRVAKFSSFSRVLPISNIIGKNHIPSEKSIMATHFPFVLHTMLDEQKRTETKGTL